MADPVADDSGLVQDGQLQPNVDTPPEAFAPSADVLTDELDPPLDIVDKGFGPVDLPTADDEPPEDMAGVEDGDEPSAKPDEQVVDEPQSQDASGTGDDVKQDPETVPYERFQQVIQENQTLKQAKEVLDWITKNPEQAAARLGGQATPQPPNAMSEVERIALNLTEPQPTKPVEDMDDTEKAQLWIEKSSFKYLKEPLEQVVGRVNELLSFKEKLEETLTRNAVTPDGTPMHPRWDELKAPMGQVKARYPGISDAEAYHLADKMIPQSTPMVDDMAAYNQAPATPKAKPEPPKPPPKRASPAALRASKVASFGRSSTGMAPANPDRMSLEASAEKALEDFLSES